MSDTKRILLDVAERSIRKRGYHAVSFRELADELDIKSASVHYYFRQKHELAVAVIARYHEDFFVQLDSKSTGAETPAERIAAIISVYRDSLHASDTMCLCGMMGAEANGLPEDVTATINTFFKANIDWISKALDKKLTPAKRRDQASQILAVLQGAFMLATSMKDRKVFDHATANILK